jgi:nucleotide-binding universal stress UspA family protein
LQFGVSKEATMKTDKILVPLDGSKLAESALADAFGLVADDGVVVLLRAAEVHALPGTDPILAQIDVVADAEQYLSTLKSELEERGIRNVETHVWYGPPAASIIDAAGLYKVDLIVMTTHGRSGVGRLLYGSVAESVLRGTTIPIFLRRPPEAPVEAPSPAAEPTEVVR